MTRRLLFLVATLRLEGGRLFVAGRNCEGNLTLGDSFTAARSGESVAVNLRVEGILTYRRYLNILDAGMTAELELSGTGLDAVAPDAALTGDSAQPLPASYEVLGEGDLHVTLQGGVMPELVDVLLSARALLARPQNDFSWSSWTDAAGALEEMDRLIAEVRGATIPRPTLDGLFAPTGPIQEVSLSSGWAQEFLRVAARYDRVIANILRP